MSDEVDPDKQKDAWGGQAFSGSGSAGGDFGPASARVDGGSYPCPPAPVPEKKVEEIPGYDGEDPNNYLDGYLERVDVKTGMLRTGKDCPSCKRTAYGLKAMRCTFHRPEIKWNCTKWDVSSVSEGIRARLSIWSLEFGISQRTK